MPSLLPAFPSLTIIVPVLNEADTIRPLVERINRVMIEGSISYTIIFIDDHSTDNTWQSIEAVENEYPVRKFQKKGIRGKAESLLEGFEYVRSPYSAILDGDLQYPPEALPQMLQQITNGDCDIVVANRKTTQISRMRLLLSRGFRYFFGKLLWNLDVDVQSGMKVFKSEVIKRISLKPKPWTFDLEFLVQARDAGYTIGSQDIFFARREAGETKVKTLQTVLQIGGETIRLKFAQAKHIPFVKTLDQSLYGFHYKGRAYKPYNSLNFSETAARRFSRRQAVLLFLFTVALLAALVSDTHTAIKVIIGALTILYFSDLLLNLLMIYRSYFKFEPKSIDGALLANRTDWPKYTIFCPLYKELVVLPQFIAAMEAIDYPKDKLEVMLLLEEDDTETVEAARLMGLPAYFKIIVTPDSMPKTKPKACNYGLMRASGQYAVIYDAEDIPDPLQLKKAVLAFEASEQNNQKVGCIQAKLNYYNWSQNWLTKLFTLEYSLWFDVVLPGLQSINAPIPLGGTSNHFRVRDLRNFGGWDPFNVTEDADLGIRLSKSGYKTMVLDSVTMEEANSQYNNWVRQRSRWIKGYIQTYFVHTRHLEKRQKLRNYLIFQLIIGGKVLSALINPLLWLMTIIYFVFRSSAGHYIHSLYSAPIFYLALTSLIVGNFLYVYIYMMAAAKRNHSELIIMAFAMPLYWLMISRATVKAIQEFIVKPFHWQKTVHGLHLKDQPVEAWQLSSSNNEEVA